MTAKELIKELELLDGSKEVFIGVIDFRAESRIEIEDGKDVIFIWG